MEIKHIYAHKGHKGNERADELAKLGARVRYDEMVKLMPKGWERKAKENYWTNRK